MKMTDEQKRKKAQDYAVLILTAVQQVFEEDSEVMHIDIKELQDSDNFKCFLHAISNIVPNSVYYSMSGEQKDNLDFNHLANHLCFDFGTMIPKN